jgi:hypothetical protein
MSAAVRGPLDPVTPALWTRRKGIALPLTVSAPIKRASATKWVIDLPAGSVGRLFDLYNTDQFAVDKGLYYTQLHLEMGN